LGNLSPEVQRWIFLFCSSILISFSILAGRALSLAV
jgi:hypothetical protein